MKTLILLRGLPGSGKSTLAKAIVGEDKEYFLPIEADTFFIDKRGNYNFDAAKLSAAHRWCQEETEFHMRYEQSPMVVSNTFIREKDMKPYYELANKYGYQVHSIIVENRHEGESVHSVPKETVEKMRNRFQIKL